MINHVQKCIYTGSVSPILGNSIIYDNGYRVGINDTTPDEVLDVAGNIRASGRLISAAANGTPPLQISSATLVSNLNADQLDGKHASWFAQAYHSHNAMLTGNGSGLKLAYWNGNTSLSCDANLHWNPASRYFGIGTSQPSAHLHLRSNMSPVTLRLESHEQNPNPQGTPFVLNAWELEGSLTGFHLKLNGNVKMLIDPQGRMGIGVSQPIARLDVSGTIKADMLRLTTGAAAGKVLVCGQGGVAYWAPQSYIDDGDWTLSGSNVFRHSGNVNIGTTSNGPARLNVQSSNSTAFSIVSNHHGWGYAQLTQVNSAEVAAWALKLGNDQRVVIWGDGRMEVDNTIKAREIEVLPDVWPDFVFSSDYELPGLDEVAAFIAANGHLPEIPSAACVEAEGIALGQMNALLLRKIEELTLYLIQLQNKINELETNTTGKP